MAVTVWKNNSLLNETISGTQFLPSQTVLTNGDIVITWVNYSTGDYQVKYRIMSDIGEPVSAELTFDHTNALTDTYYPSVIALNNGGFAITAESDNGTNTYRGLLVKYDAAGVEQSEQVLVNTATDTFQEPRVIEVGTDIWVAYEKADDSDIYIARYDDTGVPLGSFQVNSNSSLNADVRLTELSDGNVAVVWKLINSLKFNIYDSTGTALFATDQSIASASSLNELEVTALSSGAFVVSFLNFTLFPDHGFTENFQIIQNDGTLFGSQKTLQKFSTSDHTNSNIIGTKDGGFMAIWADTGQDVWYAQTFSAGGTATTEARIVSTLGESAGRTSDDSTPRLSLLNDGRVAVSLATRTDEGSSLDIHNFIVDPRNGNVVGSGAAETLHGSMGDDFIFTRGGDDTVYGYEGNDIIDSDQYFGTDKEEMYGNGGDDRLYGRRDEDTLFGGNGDDRLYGGLGNDHVYGGRDDDLARGGASNDTVQGGWGDDRVYGDAGNDVLFGGDGDDFVYGGDGDDTMEGGLGIDVMFGGIGADLLLGGNQQDTLYGGEDADELRGGAADDQMFGGEGNDTLNGGKGNDAISDDYGSNSVLGGDGDDTIIMGGTGINSINGENGKDFINGGDGNDIIKGGAGADTIYGGAGDDTVSGNSAADSFVFAPSQDTMLITDWQNNVDTIVLVEVLWGGGKTISQVIADHAIVVGSDVVFDFGGGSELTVEGVTNVNWFSNDLLLV